MTSETPLRLSDAPGTEVVSVTNLEVKTTKTGHKVVSGIDLAVPGGQVLGIVGESGSGKSTIGRALLGHANRGLRITNGQVWISGTDVLSLSSSQLRSVRGQLVAYVPQDPGTALNPARRIGSQLRESLLVHDRVLRDGETADQRIDDLLAAVRLPRTRALLQSFPHQLSGGQQQRVCIAMAFVCRPSLVVLDEPTTGLDVTTQRHILATVRQLASDFGVSAVYISHDLPVVGEIADSIAVVYGGQVVERGPTEAILQHPRHHYTARLLQAIPSTRKAHFLVGIEGRPPSPGRRPEGCVFAERCERAANDCRATQPVLLEFDEGHAARCIHPVPAGRPPAVRVIQDQPDCTTSALSVTALKASYGPKQILKNLQLDVANGECLGIVGESGSGKTTLARCLVGLHKDYHAQLTLSGENLSSDWTRRTAEQRRRIQYVFQNPYASLNPRMSVAENVAEPLRVFGSKTAGERRDLALSALDRVALGRDFANRMPDRLSGGERQRVAIARALVVEPEILICDEVTSALDVSVQALVVEQLRKLQRQGLTMLFITHNLAVVRSIAQRVVVLERGSIVEAGAVEDVLTRPQHPYTQQLLQDVVGT